MEQASYPRKVLQESFLSKVMTDYKHPQPQANPKSSSQLNQQAPKVQDQVQQEQQMQRNQQRRYFFPDVDDLAVYLCAIYKFMTPIKLSKGLYFLYAYYASTLGLSAASTCEENSETLPYPPELFKPEFHAWKLGPVIPHVYDKFKSGHYQELAKEANVSKIFALDSGEPVNMEVKLFVEKFFLQHVCTVQDYILVERSHEDEAWIAAYDKNNPGEPMDHQLILKQYFEEAEDPVESYYV